MKQKSKYRAIYKLLKTNSHQGGILLSKLIDIAIKKKVKVLDLSYIDLKRELVDQDPKTYTEPSIDTSIYRFMKIVRENREVVEILNDCDRLTAKKFIISMLSLYYSEKSTGIIKK